MRQNSGGLLFLLGAYLIWGLFPIYFKALAHVDVTEVLAHRVLWTVPFAALIVTLIGQWADVRGVLADGRQLLLLLTSALLIGVNWAAYIWAMVNERILDASLGYFMMPLMGVVLGIVLFRERLRAWQWVAVGCAVVGILQMLIRDGVVPWVGLVVAVTFGVYGAVRKRARVESAGGLLLEVLLLLPLALGWLAWLAASQSLAFLSSGPVTVGLLVGAGVATAVPLLFYVAGTRRLPLSTVSILFYGVPSLQFLVGWLLYGEVLSEARLLLFACIWLGLLIHVLEGRWHERNALAV
jgi:chloramphenicol-sensitive protein RarD